MDSKARAHNNSIFSNPPESEKAFTKTSFDPKKAQAKSI